MTFNALNQLPEHYQGIIYILFGAIILLYALGIIEKGITFIIIGLAVLSIITGLKKIGLLRKIFSQDHNSNNSRGM